MTAHRYTTGPWRAVVTPSGVVVLPATVDAAMLDRIWTSLGSGDGLGAVLETLTGAFGTSLRSIPPFAVATISGAEVRLAVRGGLAIEVDETDAAGVASSLTVSGADVTTWSERVVARGERLLFRTPDSSTDLQLGSGDWFGIADGVVSCASIVVELADRAGAPVRPSAAPVASVASIAPSEETPAVVDAAPAPVAPAPVSASSHVSASAASGMAPEATVIPEATLLPEEVESTHDDEPEAEPSTVDSSEASTEPSTADSRDAQSDAAEVSPPPLDDDVGHTRSELPDDAYDHLWGATVVKSVEEAAVRETDDDDDDLVAAPPVPAAVPEVSAPDDSAAPTPGGFAPPAAADSRPAGAASAAPSPSSGLIDSVPDFGSLGAASGSASITGHTVPPLGPPPTPARSTTAVPAPSGQAPIGPALVPSATGSTPAAVVASPPDDDHDGLTVTVSELEAMRRLGAAAPSPELPSSALGRIVLSTGETHPLDRPVIIGRRPRANRVQADQVPVLVAVASPEQDISRNHLEIRLEGRHVLVVDLATTNGSVLHRDGTPPLRLGPNEPVLALTGDVVDIGDGITVLFEDIP